MAIHTSKEDKLRIIEAFKSSELSVKEFCEKYQVCDRALYRWRIKFAPELINSIRPKFKPVKIINSDNININNSEVKIITPSGFKVIIPENIRKEHLLKIISCIGVST